MTQHTVQPYGQGIGKMNIGDRSQAAGRLYFSDPHALAVLKAIEGAAWVDTQIHQVDHYIDTADANAFKLGECGAPTYYPFSLYWWVYGSARKFALYNKEATFWTVLERWFESLCPRDVAPLLPEDKTAREQRVNTERSPYSFRGKYATYRLLRADKDPVDVEVAVVIETVPDSVRPALASLPIRKLQSGGHRMIL